MADRLTTSLSESILTVLCFSDAEKANLIANLVTPDLFESYYTDLCTRVLEFRRTFNQAPGTAHLDDLFDAILGDPKHRLFTIYTKILQGLIEQHQAGINVDYIFDRVSEFIRQQTLKSGILKAAQLIQQGGDDLADEIERVLLDTVHKKVDLEDVGIFLSDKNRALSFLDKNENDFCQLGIKELDHRRLCPTRKELFLFIGSRKSGKSTFLTHVGRLALLQRWRVVHVSLEMSEEAVVQRYFQSLYSISKRNEASVRTNFEIDELSRVIGFDVTKNKAKLNFEDPELRKKLMKRMEIWGTRLKNVVVKQFPSGSLTIEKLEAYLDSLEITHKFVPDLIILDYLALMKLSVENYTQSLGQTAVKLRGLAVKRNVSVVTAAQGNRESESANTVQSHQVAGDISLIATCDLAITYSQTPAEKKLGLARIYVANARTDEDKFTILVSQNYATSQFVLDSSPMLSNYDNLIEAYSGKAEAIIPN